MQKPSENRIEPQEASAWNDAPPKEPIRPYCQPMDRVQTTFWNRLLATDLPDGSGVRLRCGETYGVTADLLEAGLFLENGIFQFCLRYHGAPRLSAAIAQNGRLVAHALLMPTTIGMNGCAPVPKAYGSKLGLVGAYVQPDHRGLGHARSCVAAIARCVDAAGGRGAACVMAAGHIVPWCRSLFAVPVLGRSYTEREACECAA